MNQTNLNMNECITIDEKIMLIFEKYIDNNAKLWNIDTDIYGTWMRFLKKIKDEQIKEIESFYYIFEKSINRFKLYINDKEVTPTVNNDGYWSKSGLSQFFQVGDAFGFWFLDPSEKLDDERMINKKNKIKYTYEFNEIISESFEKNFNLFLVKCMQKALLQSKDYICNLGFSLFTCCVIDNVKKSYNFYINKKIYFKRIKTLKIIKNYKSEGYEIASNGWFDYVNQITKETYRGSLDSIKNDFSNENLINTLIYTIKNKQLEMILSDAEFNNETFHSNYIDICKLIDDSRTKLRKNILEKRIKNENIIKYNDLEYTFPNEWYVKDCEAAHIYDVWRIKQKVKEKLENKESIESIKKYVEEVVTDPNNGILLLTQWHDFFDKNLFSFDMNGKIVILTNEKERLLPILNSESLEYCSVRIKEKVLNFEMKEYLSLRK